MRTLHRNKRTLYICELWEDNGIRKYKEPVMLRENWQLYSTDAEFINAGLDVYNYVRIKTNKRNAEHYHLGDRVYLFNSLPSEHDVFCKTADYEVYTDPIVTLNECQVILKKLSGRNAKNIY